MSNIEKKTVIIGATDNPSKYAYTAGRMLHEKGISFVPVGLRKGQVFGQKILDLRELPQIPDVHTVTLYIGPQHQDQWYDYILSLHPERIIFNPGTENPELEALAMDQGIAVWPSCTLVLLSTGQY